ncbi:DegV family protein [Fenollaria timonensis]|uniref:DegV family protein n=1 Tax=Fenollaria timonensis TaxID=1723384 RepID=UPI0026ECF6A3|nr:DegV family protein [Fenollaria timonensis]
MTRIIIDSASDFTQEEIKEFDLEALYVSVFDTDDVETILRDGLDIKRSDIYKAMRKGKILRLVRSI